MAFKITTLTCFVAIHKDGDEGIMGHRSFDGTTIIPLICADDARIFSVAHMAEQISKDCGLPYRIIQFSARQDVTEEILNKIKQHKS